MILHSSNGNLPEFELRHSVSRSFSGCSVTRSTDSGRCRSYKQTTFNLLREQSEGYSKLVTELVATIGPAHDPATGLPAEPMEELQARSKIAWNKIVGLMGVFDLNPNRVLDVILDIFANHVLNHYAFFLGLLRLSPWVPSSIESQYDKSPTKVASGSYEQVGFDDALRIAELGANVPDPPRPKSSSVLAQILGFKFVQNVVRLALPPPSGYLAY